jgi:transposase-like protein
MSKKDNVIKESLFRLASIDLLAASCPECGLPMKKTRIGGGRRREPAWICPANQKEVFRDERGHLRRVEDSKHEYLRVWREQELKLNNQTAIGKPRSG